MKLSEIASEDLIFPNLQGTTIPDILREFAHGICAAGKYSDEETLFRGLLEREKQETTASMMKGVAIPHCKVENLRQLILAIGYAPKGVDFKSVFSGPTYFFFVFVSPATESVPYLRALASVVRIIKSPTFMTQLQTLPEKEKLLQLIREEESLPAK